MLSLMSLLKRGLGRPLILDGGMATTLESYGCDVSTKLWSAAVLVEQEGLVERAHREMAEAGCDILSTCTYQATYQGFAAHLGIGADQVTNLLRRAVAVAWNVAAQRGLLVAASIGPYGAYLANGAEYRGDYDMDVNLLKDFHRERACALWACDPKPHFLLFETLPNLAEARALLDLLGEDQSMVAVFSFQCRDDSRIASGETLLEAVMLLSSCPQVLGIGVNCLAPQLVLPLFVRVREKLGPHQVFVAYPNGGGRWDAETRVWHSPGASDIDLLLSCVHEWKSQGIGVLGGCCQVGPQIIARIAKLMKTV